MARPKTYTKEKQLKIKQKLIEYIYNHTIPIVSEFAYQNNIPRQRLYELEYITDTLKMLIDKKEANLERGGLEGSINTTMAIFSLKQLGWKDNKDISMIGELTEKIVKINIKELK